MLTKLNVIVGIVHTSKTFINGINSLKEKAWYYTRVNPSTVNSGDQHGRSCICM